MSNNVASRPSFSGEWASELETIATVLDEVLAEPEKAGLKAGDIIVSLDNEKIKNTESLEIWSNDYFLQLADMLTLE